MAKEFTDITNIGDIPQSGDFQRVNQSPTGGKTGEAQSGGGISDRVSDVVHTVKGIFADHSEKFFSLVALIGFTLIFYSGNLKDWLDFWRYSAFLGIVICFYSILLLGKWITQKIKKDK